jgi:hypothetical protein
MGLSMRDRKNFYYAVRDEQRTATSVPSTKVREIAAMLEAIHAGEDIVAAREKVIRVIEKLRALRLTRAADLVEAAVEETLAYYAPSLRSTGGASAPTIRSSASCAKSDGVRASWARSPTGNRRSTSPRPGSGTSPAPRGRPKDT